MQSFHPIFIFPRPLHMHEPPSYTIDGLITKKKKKGICRKRILFCVYLGMMDSCEISAQASRAAQYIHKHTILLKGKSYIYKLVTIRTPVRTRLVLSQLVITTPSSLRFPSYHLLPRPTLRFKNIYIYI